jgi:hypothetical protein
MTDIITRLIPWQGCSIKEGKHGSYRFFIKQKPDSSYSIERTILD